MFIYNFQLREIRFVLYDIRFEINVSISLLLQNLPLFAFGTYLQWCATAKLINSHIINVTGL